MSSHKIYGHETIQARLAHAIENDRLPQAILFTGPAGVGKQRLALWLARQLLCQREGPVGEDGCRSCLQAQDVKHPDLHWFVPLDLKKRASDPEKQLEEVETALAEIMVNRRAKPLYPTPETLGSHSIASARLIQRKVGITPFMSRKKVIIVGDADRLIVQEASQEAANALLKVLEEPPEDTALLFTSSAPQRLLDTMRSRLVPVRVGPLPDETVKKVLVELAEMSELDASRVAPLAEGSVGKALMLAGKTDRAEAEAEKFLKAIRKSVPSWASLALLQEPWGARGDFTAMLDALAQLLLNELKSKSEESGPNAAKLLRSLDLVAKTRQEAQGNVNPQLAKAVLARKIAGGAR